MRRCTTSQDQRDKWTKGIIKERGGDGGSGTEEISLYVNCIYTVHSSSDTHFLCYKTKSFTSHSVTPLVTIKSNFNCSTINACFYYEKSPIE